MDSSESEEHDNDSVVYEVASVFDEDIESDDAVQDILSDTEVEAELSGLTSASESTRDFSDAEDSELQNSQASEDSSWHPPEEDPLEDENSMMSALSSSSTPPSASSTAPSASSSAPSASSSAPSASSTAPSASSTAPSASSTAPSGSGVPVSLDDLSTSGEPSTSASSEVPANDAQPAQSNESHGKTSSEKKGPDCESPRGKKRKKDPENDDPVDSEDDSTSQTCPICMDEWSNSGGHRLCCLKCGHIYGESCIRRWLSTTTLSSGRCPQCNSKAKVRDIRPLFARSLRAIDTAERDRLAAQLEESKRERERLELEVTRFTMANQMQKAQVEKLQAELEELRRGRTGAIIMHESGRTAGSNSTSDEGSQISTKLVGIAGDGDPCHFTLRSTVEIAREGGCRVAAHCETLNLVVVSQRSTNPLFPGFGVKKVDSLEFRATQFVPAHPKPIRDLAFAPPSAIRCLLLSASFDCTARLLDVSGGANAVVATLSADTPLWSCCWDACDPNLLYVGTQGGIVLSFDVRRTSAPLSRISDPDDISPVISLVPIQPCAGRALPSGGLLSCHLSSCWAHDSTSPGSLRLPHEGPFTALRYESRTQHFLVSARPSARAPHARHSVCERALRNSRTNGGSSSEESTSFSVCNPPVHTFLGGTSQRVLSRPCLLPVRRDLVVAAHQESSSTVALWSVGTGSRVATIPASDPVIDVCPLTSNGDTHLALLTEKVLRLYRIH
ncbi:E3 ubiquitin-protein ligase RFWD3-like [Ischnura elegans]|uniref:E3 ubiquitin-protein ligase RFWD3-like n=1 Tax=Ischnura elegans TaxID=197161 RepID=UPI001ED8B8D5|nr:E3 ubiquitin-protein ligase RFWD3-like [Ischnura elegans]